MENVKTLRDDLIKAYSGLRSGKIGISEAKSLANMAGKIMSTAKVQMEFNKMTGNNKRNIRFLESEE